MGPTFSSSKSFDHSLKLELACTYPPPAAPSTLAFSHPTTTSPATVPPLLYRRLPSHHSSTGLPLHRSSVEHHLISYRLSQPRAALRFFLHHSPLIPSKSQIYKACYRFSVAGSSEEDSSGARITRHYVSITWFQDISKDMARSKAIVTRNETVCEFLEVPAIVVVEDPTASYQKEMQKIDTKLMHQLQVDVLEKAFCRMRAPILSSIEKGI
ncbi:hypothetical protein Syun_007268 [Stephania yunnanensis]|uniref:Uncharacterized protein n=1 Tax=Stephania yunnanensis TaxID=152371 RepID=A0AAP0PYD3_9MAGN